MVVLSACALNQPLKPLIWRGFCFGNVLSHAILKK
jgi:hypothetical protein